MDYDPYDNVFFCWRLIPDTPSEKMIQKVWDYYKSFSPGEMVDLTHNPGTPWRKTILKYGFSNAAIDDRLIKNHFSEKLSDLGIIENHE